MKFSGTLMLDFQASKTMENKFLLFVDYLILGFLLLQYKQTQIPPTEALTALCCNFLFIYFQPRDIKCTPWGQSIFLALIMESAPALNRIS